MKNVILAKTAGFCFGVKRAVDMVYEELDKREENQSIYTYGPIIHNEEVIRDMESRGVQVLRTEKDLDALQEGVVIIRSHGVEKRIYDKLNKKQIKIVDATCPFVKKIHNIVEKESKSGQYIVIIGDETHPEVIGIKGWADGPVSVIKTEEEARDFAPNLGQKIVIVAQTTFNCRKFKELVEIISEKSYYVSVLNTICGATNERQKEAEKIAKMVDAMIVIGDRYSSNTQKLFEISKKECMDTYYIQTLDDLNMNQLRSVETVGITAGASTPKNIIEEVQNNVRVII